jgi:cytochrome c biogenesis protein CcdA
MKEKKPFLDNIYFFRGIAIVFIVFGHCMSFGISDINNNNNLQLAILIIYFVPGGTYFFVFGNFLKLPINSERLQKLTESYVVSNAKIKAAIEKPLPISSKL